MAAQREGEYAALQPPHDSFAPLMKGWIECGDTPICGCT